MGIDNIYFTILSRLTSRIQTCGILFWFSRNNYYQRILISVVLWKLKILLLFGPNFDENDFFDINNNNYY